MMSLGHRSSIETELSADDDALRWPAAGRRVIDARTSRRSRVVVILVGAFLSACSRTDILEARAIDATPRPNSPIDDVATDDPFEVVDPTLALGHQHACAVDAGRIRCWGYNGNGQLGDGTTTDRLTPVTVAAADEFVAVAAGGNTTCAITRDRSLLCWGDGRFGQRGDGLTTPNQPGPSARVLTEVSNVAVGATHACAVRLDGSAWCWGEASFGALGVAGSERCAKGQLCRTRPARLASIDRVAKVALGAHHTCVVQTSRVVWCWGRNQFGQLGDGSTFDRSTPAPVPSLRATDVAAGVAHSCALASDRSAWCWGSNMHGKLGLGRAPTGEGCMRFDLEPQYAVLPRSVEGLGAVLGLAVGANHTCARDPGGTVACWGMNMRGELGDGRSTSTGEACSERPRTALGLEGITVLASGSAFSCARRAAQAPLCWGMNLFGQLGNGALDDRFVPTPVSW